jgi:predicted enzyme related to lactoylglutathione lyase
VALFDRDEQAEVVDVREPGDGAMLIFEVDDVDAAAARFREHVAAGPQSRPEWGIRFVHLRDPAGNVIELNQAIPLEEA